MNKKQSLITFVLIPILIISCAEATQKMRSKSYESKIKYDPLYFTYPKHRIDHLIGKICIIGDGENKDLISSSLTKIFMRYASSPIKVVEPGNLESILKGRIIEYETGLTKDESQALSQMLQVDYVLIFNEKISPHQEYIYGGTYYSQISLKIINTVSGEIIFQTTKHWAVYYPDPRPTFAGLSPKASLDGSTRSLEMIMCELGYAVGSPVMGLLPKDHTSTGPFIVGEPMVNSPSHKAGIKEGDKILEIDGVKMKTWNDAMNHMENVQPKQGDTRKIRLERAGKIFELDVKFPVIPLYPVEKRYKEEKQKGKAI